MVFKAQHIPLETKQAEKSQGLQKSSNNIEKLNSTYIFLHPSTFSQPQCSSFP